MADEAKVFDTVYEKHLKNISNIKFTRRQIDVIACLFHVWRDKEIARKLNISPNTVGVHIAVINEKLGSGGRQSILDFINRSGKETFIRKHYQNLISDNPVDSVSESHNMSRKVSFNAAGSYEGTSKKFFFRKALMPSRGFLWVAAFSCCFVLCFLIFFQEGYVKRVSGGPVSSKLSLFRSELPIPHKDVRLERSFFQRSLATYFKRETQGIKALALVGEGGSGKTTIARQYGQNHKGFVWEINSETKGSLKTSFENLAHHLAVTEKDKEELESIKRISDSYDKEQRTLMFIRRRLRDSPNWLLIFDNMEQFSDIGAYFPSDVSVWGSGKVIVTTRNSHMRTHSALHNSLVVGELSEKEKLDLFTKILNQGDERRSFLEKGFLKTFIKALPSFPLDVSIAAYYLKTTDVSPEKYLKDLNEYEDGFDSVQNHILSEVTSYSKTRYNIITLSLEKVLKESSDFKDLFLFVSLLNSQGIPKDLLDHFKSSLVVDDFIYYSKKYSLLTSNFIPSEFPFPCLSLHSITQKIILSSLFQGKKLSDKILKSIFYVLDDYLDKAIDQEDVQIMKLMRGHLEKLLERGDLFSDFERACLESKLIFIYYFLNDKNLSRFLKKKLTLSNLEDNKRLSSKDRSKIVNSLLHMAKIYIELGLYKDSRSCINKAIKMINSYLKMKRPLELSRSFYHLGNLYRRLGSYKEARTYLEKSIRLNKYYGADKDRVVRTLSCLGSVYRRLGLYQKSMGILEHCLGLCREYYSENHFNTGRVLKSLGNIHRKIGDYRQAKFYLEKSFLIYKTRFPENHINRGLIMSYLGECLNSLGYTESARQYLEKSLKIHQDHFGVGHPRSGWVMFHLASTYKSLKMDKKYFSLMNDVLDIYSKENFYYKRVDKNNFETARFLRNIAEIHLAMNNLEKAEEYINRSLKILSHHPHISIYLSFEVLGNIYLQQSKKAKGRKEVFHLKQKALQQFNKALKTIEGIFPKNSLHLERISSQIRNIEKLDRENID